MRMTAHNLHRKTAVADRTEDSKRYSWRITTGYSGRHSVSPETPRTRKMCCRQCFCGFCAMDIISPGSMTQAGISIARE